MTTIVLVTRPVCFPPGINDQVLSVELADNIVEDDTIFYQLQNLFAHLLESKLKYYVPEKFWRCFRLFGQPVNVREQQDAFEFFTQIVDQVWKLIRHRLAFFIGKLMTPYLLARRAWAIKLKVE